MCGYNDRTLTARPAEYEHADLHQIMPDDDRLALSPSLAQLAAELEVRAPHVEAPRLAEGRAEEREAALAG